MDDDMDDNFEQFTNVHLEDDTRRRKTARAVAKVEEYIRTTYGLTALIKFRKMMKDRRAFVEPEVDESKHNPWASKGFWNPSMNGTWFWSKGPNRPDSIRVTLSGIRETITLSTKFMPSHSNMVGVARGAIGIPENCERHWFWLRITDLQDLY